MNKFRSSLNRITAKQLLFLAIILLPVGVLIFAFTKQTVTGPKPKAVNGFLDLSNWDVEKNNVPLNGEWTFYWNQLLEPKDLEQGKAPAATGPITVPGIWNNKGFRANGCATYVLDVKLHDAPSMQALNILTVSNAYKMWVNGKLVATNGIVGADKMHSEPAYIPRVIVFTPDSNHLRFVVQVSNFTHCKGGFWLPVELGSVEHIQKERDARVLLEMFLFGCLFIMALYHFSLYFLRRSDPSALYFGLMCAVIGIRSLLTGENLVNNIFPDANWFLLRKIEYLLTFLSVPIYVTFSKTLYNNEWNKTIYKLILGFGLGLCVFVLLMPTSIYTNTSYVFTGFAWLTSIYTISVFARAAKRKQEGAVIFLITSLFFLLTIVNDTLNQIEIVHTGLYLSFGLLIVTFAQSFVLSSRFSKAFHNLEIYSSTFRKFVPAQFLDKIAKDGIGSIRAGHAEKAEVTVLFSDIRSFTNLAESMTPEEVFRMLNKYLAFVEPPIRANNGFVDKYIGDGIMALFENGKEQNGARNAILAALEMQHGLQRYNDIRKTSGKPELYMGIGLHAGQVIIGTLGGNERMDSTAIGDAVNLASRIEGMTKMYGVTLLVSDHTISRLDHQDDFIFRFIDTVTAKGKTDPVGIWEVIGKRSEKGLEQQIMMLPAYEKAMMNYKARNMEEARSLFEICLEMNPKDSVSAIYLERCVKFLKTGFDEHANGVTNLDSK
jgi:adenylate cyclase